MTQRDEFCTVTGTDADAARQLPRLETELNAAVANLERVLADRASEIFEPEVVTTTSGTVASC